MVTKQNIFTFMYSVVKFLKTYRRGIIPNIDVLSLLELGWLRSLSDRPINDKLMIPLKIVGG